MTHPATKVTSLAEEHPGGKGECSEKLEMEEPGQLGPRTHSELGIPCPRGPLCRECVTSPMNR